MDSRSPTPNPRDVFPQGEALHYLAGAGVWPHTHRVPLQAEGVELAAEGQVLNLHQVVYVVPLHVQDLQLVQHAELAEVGHAVVGQVQLLGVERVGGEEEFVGGGRDEGEGSGVVFLFPSIVVRLQLMEAWI